MAKEICLIVFREKKQREERGSRLIDGFGDGILQEIFLEPRKFDIVRKHRIFDGGSEGYIVARGSVAPMYKLATVLLARRVRKGGPAKGFKDLVQN